MFIGVNDVELLEAAVVDAAAAGNNSNFRFISSTGVCPVSCDSLPSPFTMSTLKPVAPKYQRTVDIAARQAEAGTGRHSNNKLAR